MGEIFKIYLIELNKEQTKLDLQAIQYLKFLTWGHQHATLFKEKEDSMNTHHSVELPEEWKSNPWIQTCLDRMEKFSGDPEKIELYEQTEKALFDYVSNLEWKYRQGIEEGIEEGREKGIEEGMQKGLEKGINETTINFIHKLYAKGMKIEEISEITNFSIEQIQKYIKN